jgi:hypothetical protein
MTKRGHVVLFLGRRWPTISLFGSGDVLGAGLSLVLDMSLSAFTRLGERVRFDCGH